jgi:mannose-6-phosphate isomerase-like protein (cupin superfamily)
MAEAVNLAAKLETFDDRFAPRTVAEMNGHDVMVAKLEGEFVWHQHDDTDDFFLVLKGRLEIELPDRTVEVGRASCSWCRKGCSTGRSRGRKPTSS